MTPQLAPLPFDPSYFNALASIEEVSEQARPQLLANLARLAPLFVEHGLHHTWGVALLHKHWAVAADERPVQAEMTGAHGKQFVTQPRRSSYPNAAWPCLLSFDQVPQGGLRPLEYSTDPTTAAAWAALAAKGAFIGEVYAVLRAHHLLRVLGLTPARQQTPGTDLVEESPEGRISILREMPVAQSQTKTLIQTSWFFSTNLRGALCSAHCGRSCGTGIDIDF